MLLELVFRGSSLELQTLLVKLLNAAQKTVREAHELEQGKRLLESMKISKYVEKANSGALKDT